MRSTKHAVRQAFDRAAQSYTEAAVLQREIGARLAERLACMRIAPARVLDAGCGTGLALATLQNAYPRARIVGLDLAHAMLRKACEPQPRPWWQRLRPRPQRAPFDAVCADIERLPLAAASIDLVWSNLALQWTELAAALRELRRVLRPGGLFVFSTFGPDTLKELRTAFATVDEYPHVNRFIDMHDIGDALLRHGFVHPVMEMEYLTLTYRDLSCLLHDLKALGAHTVLDGRRTGLFGKTAWQRLQSAYEPYRRDDGRLPATWEVIYGHAWAPAPTPARPGNADAHAHPIHWQAAHSARRSS